MLWVPSLLSIVAICVPKFYAYGLELMMIFTCVSQEDRRRKYAFRILTLTEFRMQATNVEYIHYEKNKWDLVMGFFKFALEDLPQFLVQVYYLNFTDCGTKNNNSIIYLGIILAVTNTYFGFFYRLLTYCYTLRRLRSYNRRVEVKISNVQLSQYGFRHIREKISSNVKIQSVVFQGEPF